MTANKYLLPYKN